MPLVPFGDQQVLPPITCCRQLWLNMPLSEIIVHITDTIFSAPFWLSCICTLGIGKTTQAHCRSEPELLHLLYLGKLEFLSISVAFGAGLTCVDSFGDVNSACMSSGVSSRLCCNDCSC